MAKPGNGEGSSEANGSQEGRETEPLKEDSTTDEVYRFLNEEVSAAEERADDEAGDARTRDEAGRTGRFSRFTRRLLDRKELGEDARQLLSAVLDTSDRAKNELFRLTAREIRNYLDALKLKDELLELITSHSLEVSASIYLKPLKEGEDEPPSEPDEEDT